jgi:hypothetical protein
MVKHLLPIITPRQSPASPSGASPAQAAESQQRSIRGSLSKIGSLLSQPFHNSIQSFSNVQQSTPCNARTHNAESTPIISQSSPVRTRKNTLLSLQQNNGPSPRRGVKTKLRRIEGQSTLSSSDLQIASADHSTTSMTADSWQLYQQEGFGFHGKPTTEFLGWRRLIPREIICLEVGAFILITISQSASRSDAEAGGQRKAFMDRIIAAVIRSKRHELPDNGRSIRQRAIDYLVDHHSFIRNGSIYIEIACVVKRYPHRQDYIGELLSESDVREHVQKGGGIDLSLLDFPTPSYDVANNTVLLKWAEVPAVQIFVQHRRGDAFPSIELSGNRRAENHYCDELQLSIEIVKDDPLATAKLALSFEKQRNRIMKAQLTKLSKKTQSLSSSPETGDMIRVLQDAVRKEVERSRLQRFACEHDLMYKNAFDLHYTQFQSLDRLLPPEQADEVYNDIAHTFPMQFEVIKSIIMGNQSQYESRQILYDYSDKKRSLINYFFALIRVRDPSCLVHWAMVGTMGMYTNGAKIQHFKNKMVAAFSLGERATMGHLHRLYESNTQERRELLLTRAFGHCPSDNYNRNHPIATVDDRGSYYHVGMVTAFVDARAYRVPPGSKVLHNHTNLEWTVTQSHLADSWTCVSVIRNDIGEDRQISLPSVEWTITYLPGSAEEVEITYSDQQIPPSLRQKIPIGVTPQSLLFGNRYWMEEHEGNSEMRPFTPREHMEMVRTVYRLKQFFKYMYWCTGEKAGESSLHPSVLSAVAKLENILMNNRSLRKRIESYQVDSLRYWNQAYDAVDRMFLFPICPREEMQNKEALLAYIHIMEEIALIEKIGNNMYRLSPTAKNRIIFQYGDVLTIKKWHSLAFFILRKMTEIGLEEYVRVMMTAYDRMVKIQDYLHENMHRVQAIYKLFYGGFIQASQALLGKKRIRSDPTKGPWKT